MSSEEDDRKRQVRPGDIFTTGYFAERARRKLDFDRGAGVTVNADEVPAHLRALIPVVEKWAIPGSGPQEVFIEHVRRHAPEELDAFVNALRPAVQDIRSWIRDSIEAVAARNLPAAVSHFSYTVSAYELAKPTDPDLLARGREKIAALKADEERRSALENARHAMREKRYADVVRLLGPYEAELTRADLRKLEIARNRGKG